MVGVGGSSPLGRTSWSLFFSSFFSLSSFTDYPPRPFFERDTAISLCIQYVDFYKKILQLIFKTRKTPEWQNPP